MKAVLGMLFILVGVTTGWLVLSGKLPNAGATFTPSAPNTSSSTPADAQINQRYRNQAASTSSFTATNTGISVGKAALR